MRDTAQEYERIFKAFANRRRLAILMFLKKNKEASVGDIAAEIRLSFKATSKHLMVLVAIDVLERDQRGLLMFYSLSPDQHPITKRLIALL